MEMTREVYLTFWTGKDWSLVTNTSDGDPINTWKMKNVHPL